jgi:gamma-glutamylcyclotransferase
MDYFAYGSNMVMDQMRRICGRDFTLLGRAVLPDYELGTDLRGYGNIRPRKNSEVYGLLYDIGQRALAALDSFEGYPNVFGREKVRVVDEDKRDHYAWVYLEPAEQFSGIRPSPEYFRRVAAAARENHLPEHWVEKLEDLAGTN